jgi:predicted RNA-binding Zn-ribbon protein involved in translation (DUF1610 family)
MTVSEAFLSAGIQPPVRDEWFTAPCPGCGNKQNLGAAARRRNHGYTEYACASCEAVLVVIGVPLIAIWVDGTITPSFGLILGVGVWTTLAAVGTALAMLLNGAQVMRFLVITAVVMATANILLSVALTARIGISGVVWGSVIAYTLFVLIPSWAYLPRIFARLERDGAQALG